ncbi:hypothetical protein [Nostoc favosum]|uniref:Uncharacterized protein n=1 Tax=Nostoc favosum CHAB5714 TaxID=2780399 RepID=A0ABS8ICC3_9NOSO|nr:hypothetical protein [Nostoc favosum]MCC5601787.1 hypothetical protein [Nostoc favosum CHAB5714]
MKFLDYWHKISLKLSSLCAAPVASPKGRRCANKSGNRKGALASLRLCGSLRQAATRLRLISLLNIHLKAIK